MYFVKSISGWQGSSQREPWMVRGDCDGDGAAEEGWGSHCSATGLWYHLPGKKTCDTLTQSLACVQDPAPAADLYSHRIPGLKVLRPAGSVIFAAKGSWLLSLDAQDPSSLPVLDTIALDGEVRDMELWEGKLVIAQDAGLAIVDASNPANLLFEREIWTCGRASAVEVAGDTAYFLTPAGIGSVSLEDGGAALPDYFGLLLPVSWSQWEVVEVDPSLCDDLSHLAGGLPWGPERGFEAAYGRGYVAVHKDLIVIKLNDEGFEIESSLRFTSKIDSLRQEGDFVYLDLKDGSRPLVYVRDPAEPQIAGEHSVGDWAAGATGVGGKIYRMRKNFVDIAVAR